jgi:hypothetical protein
MIRAGANGSAEPTAMRCLLVLCAVILTIACGPRLDAHELDAVEGEISARIGSASVALDRLDGDALRAEREGLVRLRLRAERIRLPAAAWAVRVGLLAALDATADGLGAAATAVDLQREAQAPRFDPVRGKEIVDRSTHAMELCRRRLEDALAALGRVHEERARLEAR